MFSHLSPLECDVVAREAISLTRTYAEYGFCVAIAEDAYEEIFPPELRVEAGTAYTFALRHCLTMTRRWAEDTGYQGRFAFFFEDGHRHADEARKIIAGYRKKGLAERFQFYSSTFIEKQDAEPLQTADIFAWQAYTAYKRIFAGKPARKDLNALLRAHDKVIEFNVTRLKEACARLLVQRNAKPGSLFSPG